MSVFKNVEERIIVPNWRSFSKTISRGELDVKTKKDNPQEQFDISFYQESWINNRKVSYAGDYISASFVMQTFSDQTNKACEFIIEHASECPDSLINLAEKILSRNIVSAKEVDSVNQHIDTILDRDIKSSTYSRIRLLKSQIIRNQNNPILYVELSRHYSIVGQLDKSIKAMNVAVHLAPFNRFVLRCAVRLFYNVGNYDLAHAILLRSNSFKYDPWLLASEIAISQAKNRNSRFTKRSRELVESRSFSDFDLSELASSLGTQEAYNGNRKKSKQLLKKAIVDPNDNSLTQVEWASKEFSLFNLDLTEYDDEKLNFELQTWNYYYEQNWGKAAENSIRWFDEMPNSKEPIILGAKISSGGLDNLDLAIKISKLGLQAFPEDSQLLNNLAYYYATNDQIKESEKILTTAQQQVGYSIDVDEHSVCLTATEGLLSFRKGDVETGRKKYAKAMKMAKEADFQFYIKSAHLHLMREEILATGKVPLHLINYIESMKIEGLDFELKNLRSNLLDKFK